MATQMQHGFYWWKIAQSTELFREKNNNKVKYYYMC